jgi:hypothetical protein
MDFVTQLFRVTWCFPTCGRTLISVLESHHLKIEFQTTVSLRIK